MCKKKTLVGRLVKFNHNRNIKGSGCNYRNRDVGVSAFWLNKLYRLPKSNMLDWKSTLVLVDYFEKSEWQGYMYRCS